ncbi:MAG: 4-hydroxy-tetrahydrodipicolinate synthase [Clostridia bacterium]|nr:4-hydroxy-tetrahydrodipicolinate synthase [Clostridia bacterium]
MKKKHIFRGAATALVTPFKDGEVNYIELKRLIEYQIAGGISAVAVCATTGEAPTLSDKEHQQIISFSAEVVNRRVPLIAGTGSNDISHAVSMSKQAAKNGADALLVVTPYYNRATEQGLISGYNRIADSTELPVIVYNVPSRTGVNVSRKVYRALAEHPNVAAVKEASGDIAAIASLISECADSLDVYSGNDDMIVPLLSLGGQGVISVLSNILPSAVSRICAEWFSGRWREASELQLKYMPLIRALFSQVNPIPVKTALGELGFDTLEMRLPMCEMDEEPRRELLWQMKRLGL